MKPNRYILLCKSALCLIALGYALSFTACKPDDDKAIPDLGVLGLGEARDYLDFKKGSYWVYKSSKTNQLDTLTRVLFKLDTLFSESNKRKFHFETIHFVDRSSLSGSEYNYFNQPLNAEVVDFRWVVKMICERYGVKTYEGLINPFFVPFNPDRPLGISSDNTYFRSKDTLTVSGQKYEEVAHFEIDKDWIWYESDVRVGGANTSYYWARGVGLIKKQVHDSLIPDYEDWNLVEYHLIK